jgi:hypothetical protein
MIDLKKFGLLKILNVNEFLKLPIVPVQSILAKEAD